jgi:uncharacterized protein (DUF433 family)
MLKEGVQMSSRYPLNLPLDLKREAALLAKQQGVSLNQFFQWAIAEKVTALKKGMDDPRFPHITYRRGSSGIVAPVLRGTGIHVETIVVAHHKFGETAQALAADYEVLLEAVLDALAFYEAHRPEIDTLIRIDRELQERHDKAEIAS